MIRMIRETPGGLVTRAPRAIREPESVFLATEGFISSTFVSASIRTYCTMWLCHDTRCDYSTAPHASSATHVRTRTGRVRYGDTRLSATKPPATRHSPANHNHVRASSWSLNFLPPNLHFRRPPRRQTATTATTLLLVIVRRIDPAHKSQRAHHAERSQTTLA